MAEASKRTVQAAQLNRLGDVLGAESLDTVEIGDRSGNFQDAHAAAIA